MILRELIMNPFAGAADRTVSFEDGLNVVSGPNEAGKSTIVNAIRVALFLSTKYTKREFDKSIERYLPISGGDTIKIGLKFEAEGESYQLDKTWGGSTSSSLVLPGGGLISNEVSVSDTLTELLVLSEGVYNSTLIAYQAGLANTLQVLSEESETSADLISILRKAVHETDGVSVERLGGLIENKYSDYFKRWDSAQDRPENNRGIENPYIKGVGKILETYYEEESLRRDLKSAVEYDEDIDQLNEEIRKSQKKNARLYKYIERHSQIAKDARKRQRLEGNRKTLQAEQREIRSVIKKWPEAEGKINRITKVKEELIKKDQELSKELTYSEGYEKNKDKLRVLDNAKKKHNSLKRARTKLDGMQVIEEDEFNELDELHHELDKLKVSLEAGKLSVTFRAKKAVHIKVEEDFKYEVEHQVDAKKSLEISAGGRVGIRHQDWELMARSGDVGIDELEEEINECSRDYQTLLDELSMASFDQAKQSHKEYVKQKEKVVDIEEQYTESLEGEDYDELVKLAKKSPRKEPKRSSTIVAKEQGKVETKLEQVKTSLHEAAEEIETWEDEFGSLDLLEELASGRERNIRELGQKITELEPLPDNIGDVDAFLDEFEQKETELRVLEGNINEYRIEIASLAGRAPEETSEELNVQVRDAETRYGNTRKEGDAIAKIQRVYEEVRVSMDDQTFDPWLSHLEEVVAPLTADRYRGTDLIEGDPSQAIRANGEVVPFDALSMGTKVGLGLAIRLAMSQYFLDGLHGFLIMDDPLIDLDPDRQIAAVRVIQEFAKEKQTIVMTCHPHHADMLGGRQILLKGPLE